MQTELIGRRWKSRRGEPRAACMADRLEEERGERLVCVNVPLLSGYAGDSAIVGAVAIQS